MRRLFASIFGSRSNQTLSASQRVQIGVEALENRLVPAVTSNAGTLIIEGGLQNDFAWVTPVSQNGKLSLRVYGNIAGHSVDAYIPANQVTQLQFRGWGGNDSFSHGTNLPCYMYGGDGNDKLIGGFGADYLYGESGDDELNDQSRSALPGWQMTNYLYGGAGNDLLVGSDANDCLFAGEGNDRLFGGNGNDYLIGEGGADTLDGGWGNDALWGGTGNDTLFGGQGEDWLRGEGGADLVYGQSGSDHLECDYLDIRDFSTYDGDMWW